MWKMDSEVHKRKRETTLSFYSGAGEKLQCWTSRQFSCAGVLDHPAETSMAARLSKFKPEEK